MHVCVCVGMCGTDEHDKIYSGWVLGRIMHPLFFVIFRVWMYIVCVGTELCCIPNYNGRKASWNVKKFMLNNILIKCIYMCVCIYVTNLLFMNLEHFFWGNFSGETWTGFFLLNFGVFEARKLNCECEKESRRRYKSGRLTESAR